MPLRQARRRALVAKRAGSQPAFPYEIAGNAGGRRFAITALAQALINIARRRGAANGVELGQLRVDWRIAIAVVQILVGKVSIDRGNAAGALDAADRLELRALRVDLGRLDALA